MGRLDGKVAIITGATRGIGIATARAFAKEGAKIATIGTNQERLDAFGEEFRSNGYDVIAVQGDLSKRECVKKLVDETVKAFGTVDILVNNASRIRHKSVQDTTDEDMNATLGSAIYGSLYCMQEVFPYMKAHGGKVINFGSLAGVYGMTNNVPYSIAKEGILGLTRSAALDWAQYMNAIAPPPRCDRYVVRF